MNGFSFYNPTQIYFGEGTIKKLPRELEKVGKNILLTYGCGSVKKSGLYDQVLDMLRQCDKNVTELSGIMSNPTAAKVREGIALCKENKIDFILAVGGGSVIDCSKAIASGCMLEEDFWDKYFIKKGKIKAALPLGDVLTMVGTGSEMNGGCVITNEETKIKTNAKSPLTHPVFSIMDPSYTLTLPKYHMVSGICDIVSHILEQYCSVPDEDNLSDEMSEALLRFVVRNARIAAKNPQDYTARSNIMWAATLGLNGLLSCGKNEDWSVHAIEHQVAAYYEISHGMGLAAVSAAYYRRICSAGLSRFKRFALNVWGVSAEGKTDMEIALEGISCLNSFFKEIGATTSLRELNITDDTKFKAIAESCTFGNGTYLKLTANDVEDILRESF
ncbi:MAG: iron-containing alcohol dehydrogenase [Oscillospiraceae bacterium]